MTDKLYTLTSRHHGYKPGDIIAIKGTQNCSGPFHGKWVIRSVENNEVRIRPLRWYDHVRRVLLDVYEAIVEWFNT